MIEDEEGNYINIELEESIRKYVFSEIKRIIKEEKDEEEIEKIKIIRDVVLNYYSQQARELTLNDGKDNNFDLYILSCRINHGLWANP